MTGPTSRARRPALLLLAAVAVPLGLVGAPAALAAPAADPTSAVGAAGAPSRPLVVTGEPRIVGDDVVLTAQALGLPGQPASARAVAADLSDHPALPATVRVDGGVEAPRRRSVLVLDTSGSMGRDGITAARQAAEAYAGAVAGQVQVGLVGFADRPQVLTAATTDRGALRAGLADLSAHGETALYDGVVLAAAQAGAGGNLVLLSDGGDTVSTASLDDAVRAVGSNRLRVDVIAFNTAESLPGPLAAIAAAGHGAVVRTSDAVGLGQAFTAAAAAVPLDVTLTLRRPAAALAARQAAVALVVGDQTYVGTVALPAAPLPPRPAVTLPVERVAPASTRLGPWVIGGLLGALLTLALVVGFWPREAAEAAARRREVLLAYQMQVPVVAGRVEPSAVSAATVGLLTVSERAVAAGGRQTAIALRLDRAGLTLLPHEWVVLRISLAVISGAVFFLLTPSRWIGLAVGAVIGWAATGIWLRVRQGRRCRAFADQLPDTLQVAASSLRSGFSLAQALAAAQEIGVQPMSAELGRALAAARIGVALEDELDRIAVRMRSEDWRLAVMAIRIHRSVGGNLSDVLSTTAKTLRERAGMARQVHALSAEGRLSAYILLALPLGVGLFLVAFRQSYVQPLWTTTPGLVMLAFAAVGMVVGTLWMFKVATVEV